MGVRTPPPPRGGVGHLLVCGYAKILGGWVPELTPPPLGWLSKTRSQHITKALRIRKNFLGTSFITYALTYAM